MSTITAIAPAREAGYNTFTDQGYAQLKPLLVVDGQQRLTSLLILISAICRHLLHANPNDQAARIAYANFVRTPLADGGPLFRVIPQSIPDKPQLMLSFMEDVASLEPPRVHVDLPIIIPAQRRLRRARVIFDESINSLQQMPNEEQVTLPNLLTCVTGRLIFILNTISDVGQAGAVFEGLNNRGLGLSALKNLKAFSIYAVQSFRDGEVLPGKIRQTASELNDKFNDAVGDIYHNLDRVELPDDTAAELLSASWPLVVTKVTEADLEKDEGTPPELLDRAQPVDDIRSSLHIHRARRGEQQAALLEALRFMICERLVPASGYFADARRPKHDRSFLGIDLEKEEKYELRNLHQRLVEMQCSAPFLPIMLAHRTMCPTNSEDYLSLIRLIERAAFWVYELGERKKGTGQNYLARLAREFADREKDFDQILLALRAFAVSIGNSTDPNQQDDDQDDLTTRVNEHLNGNQPSSVWGAFAYEWLLAKRVALPSYGKFLRRVQDNKYLQMVKSGRGPLGEGYDLTRADMSHPGNIVITLGMPEMTTAQRQNFNALPYPQKRDQLMDIGYSIDLPRNVLTKDWADQKRNAITKLAITRWAIPDDGRISQPTWPNNVHQEFQGPVEDEDT